MFNYVRPQAFSALQKFERLLEFRLSSSLQFSLRFLPEPHFSSLLHHAEARMDSSFVTGKSPRGGASHWQRERAMFAAVGEITERYALAAARPDVFCESYEQLIAQNTPALDPETVRIFAEDQPAHLNGEVKHLTRNCRIDWSWAQDALAEDQRTLVPSYFSQWSGSRFPIHYCVSSNGNGCGQTADQAKLAGLLELLERDAFALYWWTRNVPRQIDLSRPNARLQQLCQRFEKLLPDITVFHTQTDFRVNSIMLVLRGRREHRTPIFAVTAAASLDPIYAIERAFVELNQIVLGMRDRLGSRGVPDYGRDFDRSIWDFMDHALLYDNEEMKKAWAFYFPLKPRVVHWSELVNFEQGDIGKNVQFLTEEFRRTRHRLYFVNLANRRIQHAGLHVYRAFSPDLAIIEHWHRYRSLGIPRYYRLPARMGWRRRPARFADLNPYPHPFP